MYVLPLLSTLLAALFAGFGVARSIGYRGVTLYSSFSLFVACVSSLTIWYEVVYAGGRVELDLLGPWFTVGSFNATWTLRYDILAAHMLATVTTVSFAVHLYALNYMRGDPHLTLFMCYLSLFTHCMLLLVTADNLLVTMVGWEGIIQCPNGSILAMAAVRPPNCSDIMYLISFKRLPFGPHSSLFKQITTGLLLGDAWLEKRTINGGTRLGIQLSASREDLMSLLKQILYGLGCVTNPSLGEPLKRKSGWEYFQFRTFTFLGLNAEHSRWYPNGIKVVPSDVGLHLTPLALALWAMGDGSGLKEGSFKLSSHSFTLNVLLAFGHNVLLAFGHNVLLFKPIGLKQQHILRGQSPQQQHILRGYAP